MALYDFVLFDADGTLFDFDRAEAQALEMTLRAHGLPFTAAVHGCYHDINRGLWEEFERGEVTKPQLQLLRFERLFALLGMRGDARKINADYVVNLGKGAFLLPGAEEICRALQGHCRLDLVTNGVAATQKSRLEASGLQPCFSRMFVSETVGYPKPRREYFEYVFAAIPGFDRERAIIVGDSLSSDIRGGLEAGIATCWFNPKEVPNPCGPYPRYEIRTLDALREIVL